jgi:hypothetical protein
LFIYIIGVLNVQRCKTLEGKQNIGLTGPINNNPYILTQSFVSRKHYDLFEYYFPEEIINWFCDDWINEVYKGLNSFYPLHKHLCINIGGQPRYDINNNPHFKKKFHFNKKLTSDKCNEIVKRDLINVSKKKYNILFNINDRCYSKMG